MKIKTIKYPILLLASFLLCLSCSNKDQARDQKADESEAEVIVKRRDDGTVSSVNQVDEYGLVHGIRMTYYADGKSTYSKTGFEHGVKEGPANRYYRNGQLYKQITYKDGKKEGPARKFYQNGHLLAEFQYENGLVLPGLKEYEMDGSLITSYPEIEFRLVDHRISNKVIDLEISCSEKGVGVKYFFPDPGNESLSRIYLISEHGSTVRKLNTEPEDAINRDFNIIAEIPTRLGNTLVRNIHYQIKVNSIKANP